MPRAGDSIVKKKKKKKVIPAKLSKAKYAWYRIC